MNLSTVTIAAAAAIAAGGEPEANSVGPEAEAGQTIQVAREALPDPEQAENTSQDIVGSLPDATPNQTDDVGETSADNPEGEPDAAAERAKGKAGGREILVEGEIGPPPGDPLQGVNQETFEVVQAVDEALVEPVTHGYMKIFPKPVRKGIHNVVTNLDEPIVFLSFLLQLKPIQAIKTAGRFGINSTLGLGGLIDVAKKKPFNRPHVRNGFGHTLAYYGVGSGPYLYLPLIGSTTLRDFAGQMAQIPVLPLAVGKPFNTPAYVIPKVTISALDDRAQDDERIQTIRSESSNPYADYRSYYLRKRQAELDVIKGLREDAQVPALEEAPPNGNGAGLGA